MVTEACFYLLEELEASQEGPHEAPAQERLPDDGKVVHGPFVMLRRLSQVGGGFLGGDIIDRGQHPHTKAQQQLCSLKTSGFEHVCTAVHASQRSLYR